jgi:osmoprotectant transport system permease protein
VNQALANNIAERFADLPDLLSGHMLLSISALALGSLISIPLGVLAARSPRVRGPVLGVASVAQTIPGLALLALMVPLLGGTIGFLPAFIALVLYSLLPTLRNTVTGIHGVDPALIEAATGIGMTRPQVLWRVQLPLALPVIVAGLRTATVWVVGTATLSTPVGYPSLGNYIFLGLQTRNHVATIMGCVFAALLAIVLDQLIGQVEKALSLRQRGRLLAASGVLAVVVATAMLAPLWPASQDAGPTAARPSTATAAATEREPIVVASKSFTEQYILAELLSNRLTAAGIAVERKPSMGSAVLFNALSDGGIDVYVDYSGTLWATVLKRDGSKDPLTTQIETCAAILAEHGVVCLGPLGFENAYALAMRADAARKAGIVTIVDLAVAAPALKIGGDLEFFGREEFTRLESLYGLRFKQKVGMDAALMYQAAESGSVDVISAYSTDGRILASGLVIIDDTRQAFPPYDAVVLLSPRAATDRAVVKALRPLVGAIDDDMMRRANKRVDIDKLSTSAAAKELEQVLSGVVAAP